MSPDTPPRLLALGDSAWTLEFGSAIAPDINARVMGLAERVAQLRGAEPLMAAVTDVVPTFRSLTVHYDPLEADAAGLGNKLLALAQEGHQDIQQGRLWHLPVCFDADFAPDLPRLEVPAQSLAVAGEMCAVYPWESPGGWNLLGRTPVVLFDLRHTEQPALLAAGDSVRCFAVDRATHDRFAAEIARGLPRETFLKAPE